MRHIGTRLALTCSLVLLSACSERVSFLAPKFQMGSNNAQALVVTPDGEVHESGKLTVNIRGFLDNLSKKRRLLATLADVEKVVVEVSASGLSFSQTIEKADINSGTTSATFTGIPEGAATVTMKAYNLTNQLIGQASKATSVTAGNTTTVEIQLQLDPTYTQPSTGGGTTTGSITANGTIVDGPVIEGTPPPPSGTVIGTYTVSGSEFMGVDPQGNAWVNATDPTDGQPYVAQVSPTGAELQRTSHPGVSLVDRTGHIWNAEHFQSPGAIRKYDQDGNLIATMMASTTLSAGIEHGTLLEEDSQGNMWVNSFEGVYKFGADGAQLAKASVGPVGDPAYNYHADMAVDATDNLWIVTFDREYLIYPGDTLEVVGVKEAILTRHSPDGTEVARFPLPFPAEEFAGGDVLEYTSFDIGPDGILWFAYRSNQVYRIAPDGTVLGTHSVGSLSGSGSISDIQVDSAGNGWIADAHAVYKLSPTGQVLGTYAHPAPQDHEGWGLAYPVRLVIGPGGVWVASNIGGLILHLAR